MLTDYDIDKTSALIQRGLDALSEGMLSRARECLSKALFEAADTTTERVCTSSLKKIEIIEREARASGILRIESSTERAAMVCRLMFSTPLHHNAAMAERLFKNIVNTSASHASNIYMDIATKTDFSLSIHGPAVENDRCGFCVKFRDNLVAGMGSRGCYIDGSCPLGRDIPMKL